MRTVHTNSVYLLAVLIAPDSGSALPSPSAVRHVCAGRAIRSVPDLRRRPARDPALRTATGTGPGGGAGPVVVLVRRDFVSDRSLRHFSP